MPTEIESLGMLEAEFGSGMELGPKEHKSAQMAHIAFKSLAVLTYIFGNLVTSGFVFLFVICVLFLSFDFWTTKNISGRLLVGLRWWNEVKEDGSNVWIFESRPSNRIVHPTDSRTFWMGLYISPIAWLLLALGALFSFNFQWLLVVIVALLLNGANCIGYWKCERDAKKKLQSFIAQQL